MSMPSALATDEQRTISGADTAAAVRVVEAEVRELVRRRSLDPAGDPEAARALIAEVIEDYLDRAASAGLPTLSNSDAVARAVFDHVAGFGPLQPYLDDPLVEELWINAPGRVFVARHGRSELTTVVLTDEQVADLVERMLRSSGRRLDLSTPFVDAQLPDGSRLHVVIPSITRRHLAVNIRKFVITVTGLAELVRRGALTDHAARFLQAAVAAGLNIAVSGATQAGKTTMLNALIAGIPAHDRLITVEEVFELQAPLPDVVNLQTRQANLDGVGEITLRRLVKEALRMRPDRLVVGEVRQQECLDLLIALNSGTPGMCTVHANSAREALVKLCTLPLLAGENISAAFVVPTVAACIDLVLHLGRGIGGRREVREIVAVTGRAERDVIETADLFLRRGGELVRADGFPPRPDQFERAGYDLARLLSDPRGDMSTVAGG